MMRKHSKNSRKNRQRRKQPTEARTNHRRGPRQRQNKTRRNQHTPRNIPRGRFSLANLPALPVPQQEHDEETTHYAHERKWHRKRDVLENKGCRKEHPPTSEPATEPVDTEREPGIDHAKSRLRDYSHQCPLRHAACKRRTLLKRQEQSDGRGCERETNEPAAHHRPKPSPCHTDAANKLRRLV